MDPNALLERLREMSQEALESWELSEDAEKFVALFQGLAARLALGGSLPDAWWVKRR